MVMNPIMVQSINKNHQQKQIQLFVNPIWSSEKTSTENNMNKNQHLVA